MGLGVFMKGFNQAYNLQFVDFIFEFVPQITMLVCLFGFMDYMIVAKWLTDYSGRESNAPSIIGQMINNVLKGGVIDGSPLVGSA